MKPTRKWRKGQALREVWESAAELLFIMDLDFVRRVKSGANAVGDWASDILRGKEEFAHGMKFLVCGCGRGGTSLLTGVLDSHPRLEVGFEESSMACLMGTEVKTRGRWMFRDRVTAFLQACDKRAAQFAGKIYGNKITTEQLDGLKEHNVENPTAQVDVLDLFFNHYLKLVKIVFILRDGRTCVRSKLARTSQTLETACARWNFSVEVCKFLRSRHLSNICVRYEDLLVAPEKTLGPVCDFIGVDYDPQMLAGTMSEKVPKEYRRANLDKKTLAMEGVPESCLERISDGLRYCGYIA